MMALLFLAALAAPPDPLSDLLKQFDLQPNPGMEGDLQPGSIIQTRALDPDNHRAMDLSPPLIALNAGDCFPDRNVTIAPVSIPAIRNVREGRFSLSLFEGFLGGFRGEAVSSLTLEMVNPRIERVAKHDLSLGFSRPCVERLAVAVSMGEEADWYSAVTEVLVADGLLLDVTWRQGVDLQARSAALGPIPSPLGDVKISVTGIEASSTRLAASGRLVVGYRARPLTPVTAPP